MTQRRRPLGRFISKPTACALSALAAAIAVAACGTRPDSSEPAVEQPLRAITDSEIVGSLDIGQSVDLSSTTGEAFRALRYPAQEGDAIEISVLEHPAPRLPTQWDTEAERQNAHHDAGADPGRPSTNAYVWVVRPNGETLAPQRAFVGDPPSKIEMVAPKTGPLLVVVRHKNNVALQFTLAMKATKPLTKFKLPEWAAAIDPRTRFGVLKPKLQSELNARRFTIPLTFHGVPSPGRMLAPKIIYDRNADSYDDERIAEQRAAYMLLTQHEPFQGPDPLYGAVKLNGSGMETDIVPSSDLGMYPTAAATLLGERTRGSIETLDDTPNALHVVQIADLTGGLSERRTFSLGDAAVSVVPEGIRFSLRRPSRIHGGQMLTCEGVAPKP